MMLDSSAAVTWMAENWGAEVTGTSCDTSDLLRAAVAAGLASRSEEVVNAFAAVVVAAAVRSARVFATGLRLTSFAVVAAAAAVGPALKAVVNNQVCWMKTAVTISAVVVAAAAGDIGGSLPLTGW